MIFLSAEMQRLYERRADYPKQTPEEAALIDQWLRENRPTTKASVDRPAVNDNSAGPVRLGNQKNFNGKRAPILHLHKQGWNNRAIAKELKVSLSTVKRFIKSARQKD
jgi:DNA-binding NarL/FixJ family response regulator